MKVLCRDYPKYVEKCLREYQEGGCPYSREECERLHRELCSVDYYVDCILGW